MSPLQSLTAILGLSTVSGINLYLTVLVVGMGHRLGWIHGLPPELAGLGHPLVLGVALVFFLLEFVADKIPFITPLWDGIHTLIRPAGGALLALGAAAELHPAARALAMLAGGTIALGTHGGKMGVRLLAHTSPEPASHSLISLAEDLGVVALLALVWSHPALALPLLGALLLGTALLVPLLFRALRMAVRGALGALRALLGQEPATRLPVWADLALLEAAPSGPSRVLPAVARKVKGLPWFHPGFLVEAEGRWHFLHRRRFRSRCLSFAEGPARSYHGIFWDQVAFLREGRAQVLLVARELRRHLPQPGPR